jgi:hypothetical protein
MGSLGRIRSLNSLAVSDSMLRRAIASLTADPSHHSLRCLLDKYFGVLENCPSIGLLLSYMKIFSPTASLITKTVALRVQLKAAVFWCVQVFNKFRA